MKTFSEALYKELEHQLQLIENNEADIIKKAVLQVTVLHKSLSKLKEFIITYPFKSEGEEIYFFKHIKPAFVSRLIYYNNVYHIETRKPICGVKFLKKYLNGEINKLKNYFDNNQEFYTYYRTGSNYLDPKYFLRGQHDMTLHINSLYFDTDHRFSTSHDYKTAQILANNMLLEYLETALAEPDKNYTIMQTTRNAPGLALHWTESKTSLVELIYALHAQAVIDNGKADIKDIAAYFESMFHIDLGDYYRTFLELRMRKTGRTKFLDTMRENLAKRMDEQEERY